MYKDSESGLTILPYGTYVFEETSAAPGYTLAGYLEDEDGNTLSTSDDTDISMVYITQVTSESGEIKLYGGNTYTAYDSPDTSLSLLTITKYGSDGVTPLEGVTYTLYDSDGEEVATATTDSKGVVTFEDLYPDVYTLIETATVSGYTLLADPVTIELPLVFSMDDADEYKITEDTNGVIYVSSTTDADGNASDECYLVYVLNYDITDTATFTMPMTGGGGAGFIIIGAFAAACAVLLLIFKRKSSK